MRKFVREHQLLVILVAIVLVAGVTGTWATWYEYSHNQKGYPEDKHEFLSWTFFSYWYMQLILNYIPEILGTITVVVFAAKFREKFQVKE